MALECWCHQRIDDAITYYRQALAVRESVLGPDHCEVADSLVRLAGVVSWGKTDSAEAEALWRRAVAIYDRLDSQSHHVVMGLVGTLGNLANLVHHRGNLNEAEATYRRIQSLLDERYGPDCKYVDATLPAFAEVLIERGKCTEAEQRLRMALGKPSHAGSTDDWVFPHCQKLLADLCANQGRDGEAEALYRQAIESVERLERPDPRALVLTLEGLAGLCRRTGRATEAEQLMERAKQARAG
jgi:tetratricopeptide (TPR) repeat protein